MLQQFATTGARVSLRGRGANGLQVAAGAESAAVAWITRTLIASLASTSAPSCSSFLAIERSTELNAAGRFSVMVATGPSIASSAGASEEAWYDLVALRIPQVEARRGGI